MSKSITKVLVIDDDETPCKAIKKAFENSDQRAFEIETAGSVAGAEIAIQQNKFDVIIVDIMLSKTGDDEGGIKLLTEAMLFASCPDAVKIVITGYPETRRCVRAMRAGAWDFIPKTDQWQEVVLESALNRLAELEEEAKQEAQIFEEWLPKNEAMLQASYPDKYIAVRDAGVIASGNSMIALGAALSEAWKHGEKKPFILFVAKKEGQ